MRERRLGGESIYSSASWDLVSLLLIPVLAGAVSGLCRKQWRELDGRVRSGDKRGAAAPVKGEEAPPRHCSIEEEAAAVLDPHIIWGRGMDGLVNELVSQRRLVGFQSSAVPLLGPWPFSENWYRSSPSLPLVLGLVRGW